MYNEDYDKKVKISLNEISDATAKTILEEPFSSIVEENEIMMIIFPMFAAKIAAKLFEEKITKGDVKNGRSN